MSTAAQTKIFGIRLGIDPKILVVALVALAGLLFWYNSGGEQEASRSATVPHAHPAGAPAALAKAHKPVDRHRNTRDTRGTLRLIPVDPTQGDVDPVLRLDLLNRLSKIEAPSSFRNLFESGPAANTPSGTLPNRIIPVKANLPPPSSLATPVITTPTANIPYKYYGFAKPVNAGDGNRGFFMEGDNIFVAVEGQLLQQRYLVVQLTPTTARVEDTQVKLGQNLPLVPEALAQSAPSLSPGRPVIPGMNPMMNPMLNHGDEDPQ